jgi:hypothetical protein
MYTIQEELCIYSLDNEHGENGFAIFTTVCRAVSGSLQVHTTLNATCGTLCILLAYCVSGMCVVLGPDTCRSIVTELITFKNQ